MMIKRWPSRIPPPSRPKITIYGWSTREIFSKNPEVQERMHKINEASKEKETSKEE